MILGVGIWHQFTGIFVMKCVEDLGSHERNIRERRGIRYHYGMVEHNAAYSRRFITSVGKANLQGQASSYWHGNGGIYAGNDENTTLTLTRDGCYQYQKTFVL